MYLEIFRSIDLDLTQILQVDLILFFLFWVDPYLNMSVRRVGYFFYAGFDNVYGSKSK